MLLALVLVLAAVGLSAAWLTRALRGVREEQVRRGLFGEPAREGLIWRWVSAAVDLAERQVRLGYFGGSLRARMWQGTIAEITRPHARGATTWRFSDGEVWLVELVDPVPRAARRVVVRSVEQRGPHLCVHTYVPGGLDIPLSVVDARVAVAAP